MGKITPEVRSAIMSRIRGKNTRPELIVRSLIHRLGFRFRLHRKDLPGTPDLVFPAKQKVIFVNGCFWHWHQQCKSFRASKTRVDFWKEKLTRNRRRDASNRRALEKLGWEVLTIWECQLCDSDALSEEIQRFLV
ncbi:MAG: DNA mismatch endonuclease Vsr [Acidobacteria bacterium]|nr:DNA mismatch endonuclease Vsr [Acidobacteriota bacterium]